MNMDCQWIDKNVEALFTGTLSPEEQDRAQQHIENCGPCGKEIAALNSIDPLVKRYFESEMNRVRRATPRTASKGRLIVLGSAALAAVAILLAVILQTQRPNPSAPKIDIAQSNTSAQPGAARPARNLDAGTADVERAKPSESAAADITQSTGVLSTPGSNAPDFLVSDPAGYSRTLDDYRGHIFVIGILKPGEADSVSNLERLYRMFETNPKFRFLAVSNDRRFKPTTTTFPVAYNQGSRLLGAAEGDFLLLDEGGSIQLHGSLIKDFDNLQKTLQQK